MNFKTMIHKARLALTGRGTVGDHLQTKIRQESSAPVSRVSGDLSVAEQDVWNTLMIKDSWPARVDTLTWLEESEPKTRTTRPRRMLMTDMCAQIEAGLPALAYRAAIMPLETRLAQMISALRNTHPEMWLAITDQGKTDKSSFEVCERMIMWLITDAEARRMRVEGRGGQ